MSRKNIILMSVDEGGAFWRYRDLFGVRLQLPNLDRICARSKVFTSAYCQTPICGPSRNSMLSGLSPYQTGILDNYTHLFDVLRPEQLWQFHLKQSGYFCSTAGKVHHGFDPLPGHIHDVLYSDPPTDISFGPKDGPMVRHGGVGGGAGSTNVHQDAEYYDYKSSHAAVDFLLNYDRDQPFYREVGFHHPHLPLRTPQRFKDLYDEEEFEFPECWEEGFDTASYPSRFMMENMDLRDRNFWRKTVRNYFSAYSHVDSHIGRVWDALQASPHKDNTIFVFVSDHGYHLDDKNRFWKFTLWEESCRVPLIIHDPDAGSGEVDDPVALLDVGPTILDYAGCPPLEDTLGKSLKPMVHGARDPERAVPTFLYGNVSIRKGPYRITLYQNGESELHDVNEDPWLTTNLTHEHPDYGDMRRELVATCEAHGLEILGEAANFTSSGTTGFILGAGDGMTGLQSGSFGAIETLGACENDNRQPDGPPPAGYKVHYTTFDENCDAVLPAPFSMMHYGADSAVGLDRINVFGNALDNRFLFPGGANRFLLSVHTGPGDNHVQTLGDDLIVYCGDGDNVVQAGNANCHLFGGSGTSTFFTNGGQARIVGGRGPSRIRTGSGSAEISTGEGRNHIVTGSGEIEITVNGGINEISISSEKVTLNLRRTGLPQVVRGFRAGKIDISDWAISGPVSLKSNGVDLVLSCATEEARFVGVDLSVLKPAFIGGTVLFEG